MKIEISEYNPEWIIKFNALKNRLWKTFNSLSPVIEHVGSTSVPGLGSKPVIDILIGVKDLNDADKMIPGMIKLGYEYVSEYETEIPDRRYFKKKDAEHLHTVIFEGEFWNRLILFRDYLRINKNAAEEYFKLKKKLSKKEWNSSNEYAYAKTELIAKIEKEAEVYFSGNN